MSQKQWRYPRGESDERKSRFNEQMNWTELNWAETEWARSQLSRVLLNSAHFCDFVLVQPSHSLIWYHFPWDYHHRDQRKSGAIRFCTGDLSVKRPCTSERENLKKPTRWLKKPTRIFHTYSWFKKRLGQHPNTEHSRRQIWFCHTTIQSPPWWILCWNYEVCQSELHPAAPLFIEQQNETVWISIVLWRW